MTGNPFHCPWDSGQVGYVYMTKAKAIKEWGKKICSKHVKDMVYKCMQHEIEALDNAMTGNVYGYNIEPPKSGGCDDSCCGFNGDMNYCLQEAKSAIDCHIAYTEKKKQEALEQELDELAVIYA